MATLLAQKQLAVDTNLLLDLADDADFAWAFKEAFQARNYVLKFTPTVAVELHENWLNGPTPRKRELARIALSNARRKWQMQPVDLTEIEMTVAERFAQRLLQQRLLPEDEYNDGVILAEASLANIPLLVTSDKHLLDMDEDALLLALNDADLTPVRSVHPKRLLRALG